MLINQEQAPTLKWKLQVLRSTRQSWTSWCTLTRKGCWRLSGTSQMRVTARDSSMQSHSMGMKKWSSSTHLRISKTMEVKRWLIVWNNWITKLLRSTMICKRCRMNWESSHKHFQRRSLRSKWILLWFLLGTVTWFKVSSTSLQVFVKVNNLPKRWLQF